MPTDEQLRQLIDMATASSGTSLQHDLNLIPTRTDYQPTITAPLVNKMQAKLAERAGTMTDLIGCVMHYYGVEGVDYRPISIDQEKMIHERLMRVRNLNPIVRQFHHVVIGIVRGPDENPYDVSSHASICIGLY